MPKPQSDEQFFDILYSCRAMRRLETTPVPQETLEQLVDAALQGPSGSNAQNWRFVIVRDENQKRRIAEVWKRTWDFYLETFAKAAGRPGEDLEARGRMLKAGTYMVSHLAETPAIIFPAVKQDDAMAKVLTSPSTMLAAIRHFGAATTLRMVAGGVRTGGMADGSTAYPAVQNLLLAARALGLGAVLATPQFFVPGEFENILGLPSTVTIAAAIPVGYPKGKFGPVRRPQASSVIDWDRYSS